MLAGPCCLQDVLLLPLQECAHVTDPAEIDKLCDEAMDAAKFMRDMVVQAKLNERGNYGRMQAWYT